MKFLVECSYGDTALRSRVRGDAQPIHEARRPAQVIVGTAREALTIANAWLNKRHGGVCYQRIEE